MNKKNPVAFSSRDDCHDRNFYSHRTKYPVIQGRGKPTNWRYVSRFADSILGVLRPRDYIGSCNRRKAIME